MVGPELLDEACEEQSQSEPMPTSATAEPSRPPPPVNEMRRANSAGAAELLAAGGGEDAAMREMIAKLQQELAAKDEKLADAQHALSEVLVPPARAQYLTLVW